MSYKLGGRNALAYLGVEPTQPPQMLVINRPPTSKDSQNVNIGTFWVVPNPPSNPEQVWILVSLIGGVATWVQLYPISATGLTFDEDLGSAEPIAGVINVIGGAGAAGTNIHTLGNANNVYIILNDSLYFPFTNSSGTEGVIYSGGSTFLHNFGTGGAGNTFLGTGAGNLTLGVNCVENTGIGGDALASLVGSAVNLGDANTAIGVHCFQSITDGSWNTGVSECGIVLTTGQGNCMMGWRAGNQLVTGNTNILIGADDNLGSFAAGYNYTGAESNNICLQSSGVTGESNVMRLGNDGSGSGQVNTLYLAGTYSSSITSADAPKVLAQDTTTKVSGMTLTSSDSSITITITGTTIDFKVT